MEAEFIYRTAPFPSCHASTIAESQGRLVAAWFGGTHEKHEDVGIWLSRHDGTAWSAPIEVADGVQADDTRHPCWNPALFQPADGPLMLFYKVGPSPSEWWGMLITSQDAGATWSEPKRLPDGVLGPIKNKPVQLADGAILCPSSTEHEHDGWRVHLERTTDLGQTWETIGPLNDGEEFAAIQPSILIYPSGRMQLLCRSMQGCITQCWSEDGGATWGEMAATILPNPNSGTDAAILADGRAVLIYNHSIPRLGEWGGPRTPLNVAVSDDGEQWQPALLLEDEPGEYSYPAVIQTASGLVHFTYTWHRERIKHVVADLAELG